MAWWDHEELKPHGARSNRYFFDFSEEYSAEEKIKRCREIIALGDIKKNEYFGYAIKMMMSINKKDT